MNTGGRDTVGHCSCALESSNSGDAGMGRKRTGRQDHSDNCFGLLLELPCSTSLLEEHPNAKGSSSYIDSSWSKHTHSGLQRQSWQ